MVPLANDVKRLNRSKKRILVHTSRNVMLPPRLAHMVTRRLVLPTCTAMKQRSAKRTPLQTTHEVTFATRRATSHAFGLGPHTLCQHTCTKWRLPKQHTNPHIQEGDLQPHTCKYINATTTTMPKILVLKTATSAVHRCQLRVTLETEQDLKLATRC